jgi:hypothetical protein
MLSFPGLIHHKNLMKVFVLRLLGCAFGFWCMPGDAAIAGKVRFWRMILGPPFDQMR